MPGMIYDALERDHGWEVAAFGLGRVLFGRYAIIHVSFPNEAFRSRSKLLTWGRTALAAVSITFSRMFGTRLVWTVHNIADHESYHPGLESWFMAWFNRRLDLVVHMSEAGRLAALERYPSLRGKPSTIIRHPHYGSAEVGVVSRETALAELGLPPTSRLMLAFGVVRRYKNLLTLARAFSGLPPGDARLLIAGMPLDSALAAALRATATDERITLMLRAIPPERIGTLFSAARLVVAPYLDILNSGTALLSLTYARPVLVPNRGAMTDLLQTVGPDWVRLYDPPLDELVLADASDWAARPRLDAPDLSAFDPRQIVAAYDAEFTKLLD